MVRTSSTNRSMNAKIVGECPAHNSVAPPHARAVVHRWLTFVSCGRAGVFIAPSTRSKLAMWSVPHPPSLSRFFPRPFFVRFLDSFPAFWFCIRQIGVCYDLSEVRPVLSFAVNGQPLDASITDLRCVSDLYPAVSVSSGAMLEANFGQNTPFAHPPSNGAQPLMLSRDMI
jgi:hypothetical protein